MTSLSFKYIFIKVCFFLPNQKFKKPTYFKKRSKNRKIDARRNNLQKLLRSDK